MNSAQSRAHRRFRRIATRAALGIVALCSRVAAAQQPPARTDTVPLRADYRDLNELLQKLPNIAPPAFDESRELWLAALPLACMDRLQSRTGGRGGAARGAAGADPSAARGAAIDSAAPDAAPSRSGRASARGAEPDSAGRGAAGRGGGANNGAGYFWLPTYTLVPDHDRVRAFWGCNDFHSDVSSTWVTVRLLKAFPNTPLRELAREKLSAHLGKSNLDGELAFFRAAAAAINPIPSASQQGGLFERPYGFSWVLKLQAELRTWPDTQARRWSANMAPLAAWMADSRAYLAKLVEPVRAGSQANTALSMTLALDYADEAGNTTLRSALVSAARRFYLTDKVCATQSERVVSAAGRGGRGGAGGAGGGGGRGGGRGAGRGANADSAARAAGLPNDLTAAAAAGRGATPPAGGGGGPDMLSPCLTEAALMSRVLEPRAFTAWLDVFLPPLQSGLFAPLTEPVNIPVLASNPVNGAGVAPGSARAGAPPDSAATAAAAAASALATERARLCALSFERAQAMERIAHALAPGDPRVVAWHRLSAIQADRGFELMRDDTAGIFWLPAQALLYVTVRK